MHTLRTKIAAEHKQCAHLLQLEQAMLRQLGGGLVEECLDQHCLMQLFCPLLRLAEPFALLQSCCLGTRSLKPCLILLPDDSSAPDLVISDHMKHELRNDETRLNGKP